MKWIALAPILVLLTACGCCTNRDDGLYRQVIYKPASLRSNAVWPGVKTLNYDPVNIVDESPVDIRTTAVDYY